MFESINFLHRYIPQPYVLELGSFTIHWYGVFIVLGIMCALMTTIYIHRLYKEDYEYLYDLLFFVVLGGVLGGRLYYVIYAWEFYKKDLFEVVALWHGGLAIHGVLMGGALATYIYTKKHGYSFFSILDKVMPGLIIAQGIGRLGNYFNQELFGRPTDVAWSIPIERVYRPVEYLNYAYFHPTFLYELIGNVIIGGILLSLHMLQAKKYIKLPGGLFVGLYMILYGINRFSVEMFRVDYSPYVGDLRVAQIASIILALLGIMLIGYVYFKNYVKLSQR